MLSSVICEHRSSDWCDCIPRRRSDYVIVPALYRLHGERPPAWACQCRRSDGRRVPRKYRHTSEIDCVPRAELEAFKATYGIKSDGVAKALMFIETFHPREEGER